MKKLLIIALVLLWCTPALADSSVFGPYAGTGHYYQRIDPPTPITWPAAKTAAELMDYFSNAGYLATLTSQEENDYVWDNLGGDILETFYLGGTDSASEGTWQWVAASGDTWGWTNWGPGEPNDSGGEDYLAFARDGGGIWNDDSVPPAPGYVVEFTPEPISSILFLVGGITLATRHYRKKRK